MDNIQSNSSYEGVEVNVGELRKDSPMVCEETYFSTESNRMRNKKKKTDESTKKRHLVFDETLQENIDIFGDEDEDYIQRKSSEKERYNLFVFIYDPKWPHWEKDKENLMKALSGVTHSWIEYSKQDFFVEYFINYLRDLRKDDDLEEHEIFKIIIYYSGHGGLFVKDGPYDEYASFLNGKKHIINTKHLFDEVADLRYGKKKKSPKMYDLVVLIADMCSTIATMSKNEEDLEFLSERRCQTSYFDFQGRFYIRTSQRGTPTRGNIKAGSYFLYCFTTMWNGSYPKLITDANDVLRKYQVASKEGSLVDDFFITEDEVSDSLIFSKVKPKRVPKRKREDTSIQEDDGENPAKRNKVE